jgi:tetratricopeptide (TPR) repeat protein
MLEDDFKSFRGYAARITDLGLSSEAETFALAELYAGHGLIAEAIEILEDLVKDGSQQTAVHQALADLYKDIGLLLLAEPRYLEAAKLAEARGNPEAQAAIQASLGEVYVTLNNTNEAIRWLTQAQAGYEVLGDGQRASEIAERLAELSR